ncbi:hypothetical protein TNCV_1370821 [Trichonephila clavipes]|nr:hypothetical protein TNCV_1370821 [Trichonephila clavipes]
MEYLIDKSCEEDEGPIQIISAFGEKEIAALKLFNLKIDDGKHGSVPIMYVVTKKLVNDILISATAYEIQLEDVLLFDFGNQRDFESTKAKDIEFRNEMEELRKETENETRTREARHKEKEKARLKAEVETRLKAEEETKAVVKRRRIGEERRTNEIIALEEEMILKKERWLVEEQIRHVQEEHKMRMIEEQKCLPEERCKKAK